MLPRQRWRGPGLPAAAWQRRGGGRTGRRHIARDIPAGSFVNLGIGQPTNLADHLPAGSGVVLHTENGMLNMGPKAEGDAVDPDLANAGKVLVTESPGVAYFHHADSFAMMRGGHRDVCVLGAYQVAFDGDLANWTTGKPDDIPAVGGAMDLAIGAKDVYVMMTLFTRSGEPKLVPRCTYRLHIRETYGISAHDLAERRGVTLFWVGPRAVIRRGREPGSIGTTGSRPAWPVRRRRSAG